MEAEEQSSIHLMRRLWKPESLEVALVEEAGGGGGGGVGHEDGSRRAEAVCTEVWAAEVVAMEVGAAGGCFNRVGEGGRRRGGGRRRAVCRRGGGSGGGGRMWW
ncbi:unnamed protein product [Cuscuta epithymum]|uniref:Uncharacterized protein n=1 Tax=Cuscuta epithymum TaxID=186058 RepID=A0AAV0EJ10_9ASTE|nr:unnamed protein product [Cuscuta epithymum]